MTYRKKEINRETVFNILNLREIDFFPSPTHLRAIDNLISTKQLDELTKKINNIERGFLLVHGIGGTGKTTSLQLLNQRLDNLMIIYDCYADGDGMTAGEERYPYSKFFVQVINEIDSIFHTNILATTKLKYTHLMNQFSNAIKVGSELARKQDLKLIISIDAIDNAVLTNKISFERNFIKYREIF